MRIFSTLQDKTLKYWSFCLVFFLNVSSGVIVNLEITNLFQMGRKSQSRNFLGGGGEGRFRKSISNSWFQCSWTDHMKTKHLIVFIKILDKITLQRNQPLQ